jgi:lipopolysaccharide export system permease protein
MMMIIMSVAMVFDMSEKLLGYIAKEATLQEIMENYFAFVLFYGNLFSPLIAFISVIWFTSKMAQLTEVIPILSSGIGFRKYLLPYFIGSLLIAFFSGMLNHYWLPSISVYQVEFEDKYYRTFKTQTNIHKEINNNEFIYLYHHNANARSINNFFITNIDGSKLSSLLSAKKVTNDSTTGVWTLHNYKIRTIGELNDKIETGASKDTVFNFSFEEIAVRTSQTATMTTPDLKKFIAKEKERGSTKIAEYKVVLYNRTAIPAGIFILTLIGVAVSHKKSRQGTGIHIATGLLFALIYIFFQKIGVVFGTAAGLNTFISAWFPNIAFSIVAIFLLKKMIK